MAEQQARLKIDLAAKKVEIEGSERFVKEATGTVKALVDFVNKIEIKGADVKEEAKGKELEGEIQAGKIKGITLGEFIRNKQVTQGQKVALIAEWLRQNKNKDVITDDDVKNCYTDLGDPAPDRLDATIRNAAVGGKKLFKTVSRGKYELTYQGKMFVQKGKESILRISKKRKKKSSKVKK